MESAGLPLVASGIVPVTRTDFPTIGGVVTSLPESGTRFKTSVEPETCKVIFQLVLTTVPAMLACESFIVNPFLVIASFSCFRVVVFPGFIFTTARPFSRLTSTESTPATDFNDTRTACAQTSQSMPKISMSIDLISAEADAATSRSTSKAVIFFMRISLVRMLKQQVTEIDCEANSFLGKQRPDVLIDRHLRAEAHRAVVIYA